MSKLSEDLVRASSQMDKVLEEITVVRIAREQALKNLESKVGELTDREKQLQTRIETLKSVPLPAVEYFLQASEKREKSSAKRDYFLFGLGVITSTVLTVILKLIFNI